MGASDACRALYPDPNQVWGEATPANFEQLVPQKPDCQDEAAVQVLRSLEAGQLKRGVGRVELEDHQLREERL